MANGEIYMKDLVTEVLSGMETSCKGCYDPKNIVYAEIGMNGDDSTFILHQIKCEGKNSNGKDFKCNCVPTIKKCNCVPTIKKTESDSTPTGYDQKDINNT